MLLTNPHVPMAIKAVLGVHITGGFIALVVAPIALAMKKGGPAHRRWGMAYVVAMTIVALTALITGPFFNDWFLVAIAVLSGYLALSGWRALRRKRPSDLPEVIDWIGAGAAVASGAAMIALAIVERAAFGSFVLVLGVLGAIAIRLGWQQLRVFRAPAVKGAWLTWHIRLMIAAYIATVTAFSATNLHFIEPIVLRWLWPALAGTLLIIYFTRKYQRAPGAVAV